MLNRSQLEVNNQVVLSRLGLTGGRDADFVRRELGIPMSLALALMKDYRGDIQLDLPFGGDVSQPTFEMRSVVLQAIVRAIRGAVLSPLNALGRVLAAGRADRTRPSSPGPLPARRTRFGRCREGTGCPGRARAPPASRDGAPRARSREHGRLERLTDEAALAALVDAPKAEPLREYLRARLTGAPPPPLDEASRARLEALRAGVPWPASELRDLAQDRGAVAAASLIVDHHVDPERVVTDPPVADRDALADTPAAAVELEEAVTLRRARHAS